MAAPQPRLNTLVSCADLVAHPEWRVFDCRHDLLNPEWGAEEYRKSHIPGALFASLDRDLSAPKTGKNGRHPLPDPHAFIAWLGKQGLKPTDQVVCYDQGPGSFAARLWWMLRWAGHDQVAVLDGGLAKWLKEGRRVTADNPSFPLTSYAAKPRDLSVGVETVSKPHSFLLLDARAPARFRGEQEPIDPVAGHIPGALNRFNNENLTAEGTFKSPAALRAEFEAITKTDPRQIVHYCGSGVAACHNLLAMEVAGMTGGKLYAGSWSEWIADPARTVARGA
jgi:thiosulfate/3-mercaptopyruvate sulfurtransferase